MTGIITPCPVAQRAAASAWRGVASRARGDVRAAGVDVDADADAGGAAPRRSARTAASAARFSPIVAR